MSLLTLKSERTDVRCYGSRSWQTATVLAPPITTTVLPRRIELKSGAILFDPGLVLSHTSAPFSRNIYD